MRHLLVALGKNIKQLGHDDRWIAKCPIHNDKDFAMNITRGVKGGLVMRCHACGATGIDVYKKLGLPFAELFGTGYKRNDQPRPILTQEEKYFKAIYESDLNLYKVPFESEMKKYNHILNMLSTHTGR